MCRLLASLAPSPRPVYDVLVDAEFSLLRQADADPKNPQKDGWGLAWFDASGAARVTKSGRPAPEERARYCAAAEAAGASKAVVAHIRAASNQHWGDEKYAHPFSDEGWVFAHNGTLTICEEAAAALGTRRARLKTDGDSEIYFQQFLKHLAAVKDPSMAFESCIKENWLLWDSAKSRYPGAATPYTSLNAIASDGRGVHALCHASRRGAAAAGVCHPDQPWSVMSFSTHGGRFVLASEDIDGGDWTRLTPPETISAVPAATTIDVRRRVLSLDTPYGPVPEVARS